MISVKPLSQHDPSWASIKLGFSNLTIGQYGCTLTSLTMFLNHLGYAETPATVNVNLKQLGNFSASNPTGAFSGALLVWMNIYRKYPRMKFVYRDYNYQNYKVWTWINVYPKLPVLVEVNGAIIGGSKHWVLYKGSQRANDPWTGREISTSFYPATGDALLNRA